MKPKKIINMASIGSILALVPCLVWALPDGMSDRIPADLVIPDVPVKVMPDADSANHFYVLPLEGMSSEVKDADVAYDLDCKSIKDSLVELEQKEQEMRSIRAEVTGSETRELINEKEAKEEKIKQETAIRNQVKTLDADIAKMEAEEKTYLANASRSQMVKAAAVRSKIEKASRTRESLQAQLNALSHDTEGDNAADKGTREDSNAQKESIRAEIEEIEAKIAQHRRVRGGTVKMVVKFAPEVFLDKLRKANAGSNYTFSYVPSAGGFVDITFPTGADVVGNPILSQKWDSTAEQINKNPFSKALGAQGTDAKLEKVGLLSPTNILQNLFRQFSDPLEGSRQLTAVFSQMGMCAFTEPRDFIPNAEQSFDTYSLTYFFSYPARFNFKAYGHYHGRKILDELLTRKKKSGFFSSSDRTDFIKTVSSNQYVDIKVDAGVLAPEIANQLRDKVAEYISFNAVKDELELRQGSPATSLQPLPESGQGVKALGSFVSKIPSPWAFWTGGVLSVLGNLGIGGSRTTFHKHEEYQNDMVYNETQKFSLPIAATVTIGRLKPSDFKK